MADVTSTLASWSTTESANQPVNSTVVGSGLDDNIRQIQATVRSGLAHYNSSPVASSGTVNIGAATGNFLDISGTTTITAFDNVSAGVWKVLRFTGALTLTYNATSLILPGAANISTAAGDVAKFYSLGSGNWVCAYYMPADGRSIFAVNIDSEFAIADDGDTSKRVSFQCSGITTSTVRTLTVPDATTTIVGTDVAQTLTNKTLTSPVVDTGVSGTAVATQAVMETATSTTTIVSPGNAKYHPGAAKYWARVTFSGGTPAIVGEWPSGGSVTDNGIGVTTITYPVTFSAANHAPVAVGIAGTTGPTSITGTTITSAQVTTLTSAGAAVDANFSLVVYGDLT